jgi:hypothetical protein
MTTLPAYFGAAYLINLPERKDRLTSATRELARAGWTFGPGGVQLYAAQRFTDRAGFPGSPSVRGAFHSHLECIRAAQRLGTRGVLIMEDDIALAPSIDRLTPSIVAQLESAPWGFCYLGHGHTGDIGHANARTTELKLVPTEIEIGGAHFYCIHSRIYTSLLAFLDRLQAGREGDSELGPMPIDGAYNVFRRRNPDVGTLLATPKLGWQRPSRSDISPRPIDRLKPLQPILSLLRNFKHAIAQWRSERW